MGEGRGDKVFVRWLLEALDVRFAAAGSVGYYFLSATVD